jgi:outer membrane protein
MISGRRSVLFRVRMSWCLTGAIGPSVLLLMLCLGATNSWGQAAPAPVDVHVSSITIDAPSPILQVPSEKAMPAPERLELTLQQAIARALENNLDIQIQKVDQSVAESGIRRTQGGGAPSQLNYNIAEAPAGLGTTAMPLLTSASPVLAPTSVDPSGIAVSSSYNAGHVLEAQHSLSLVQAPYSAGSAIPAFDPELQGQFAWIRHDPSNSIQTGAAAGDLATTNNTLGNATFLKGFSSGASVQLGVNDFVQSFYSGRSSAVPFTRPNAIALIAQPLLRGAGRANNTRFIAIAKTNRKISSMVLEQQMISTVSGVEALYYDLISLQDVVEVQRRALKAAEDLQADDQQQLAAGRMPPIEVARAEALVTANRLALTQADALRLQQANVLRSVVDPQSLTALDGRLADLVATDSLAAPSEESLKPVGELIQIALAQRPDIQQSRLQVTNGERAVAGSSNARLPEIDVYGSVQSRGVIAPGLLSIAGDPLTGAASVDPVPAGGKSASRLYEVGIQFNLPVQNRVAQANWGADRAELRQERLRLSQIEAQAAAEVRNTVIGLGAARLAAEASTASRQLQEKLLGAEVEKFRAGMSTNFAVIQQETYLAQAETTEVAARAAVKKADVQLQRALGETLTRNGIELQDDVSKHERVTEK